MKSLKHIIDKYFAQTRVFMISATISAAYLQIVSDMIASLNLINLITTYSLYMVVLAAEGTL
jgi:hypothetical protein